MDIEQGTFTIYTVETIDTFKWDHHNRLTEFEHFTEFDIGFGGAQQFTGLGGTVTLYPNRRAEYVHDLMDQLVAVQTYTAGGSETTGYVNESGRRVLTFVKMENGNYKVEGRLNAAAVDRVLAVDAASYEADWDPIGTPRTTWTLADQQGTVRDLVAKQGGSMIHDVVDYDVFGAPQNTELTAVYLGQEYDLQSDLFLAGGRWYDPAMGRFIAEDPRGVLGSGETNLYRFGNNSPINVVDRPDTLPGSSFWEDFSWYLNPLHNDPLHNNPLHNDPLHNDAGVGDVAPGPLRPRATGSRRSAR